MLCYIRVGVNSYLSRDMVPRPPSDGRHASAADHLRRLDANLASPRLRVISTMSPIRSHCCNATCAVCTGDPDVRNFTAAPAGLGSGVHQVSRQAAVINAILSAIGITNRKYVEIGFNVNEQCAGESIVA